MARWERGEHDVEALLTAGELEYPERPGDDATQDEAGESIENAEAIVTAAQGLLDQLGLF